MRNLFVGILMILLLPSNLSAQYYSTDVGPRTSKIFFGGHLGFQFGSESVFDISPLIGVKLMPNLSLGLGLSYQYYSRDYGNVDYSTSIYGGRIFTTLDLIENIYVQFEYEYLNYEGNTGERIRVWNYLVGGGYRQWIAPNVYMNFMLLFNINKSNKSPYQNPFYRVGIEVRI
jgi:outer membrane protein assembly factor BamA